MKFLFENYMIFIGKCFRMEPSFFALNLIFKKYKIKRDPISRVSFELPKVLD